jgi:hypothetical protein
MEPVHEIAVALESPAPASARGQAEVQAGIEIEKNA